MQRPIVYTARRLRREMSLPEVLLWRELRKRPGGVKFRRQHPVDPNVGDFFCREAALVIEVDGSAHELGNGPQRDEARDARLRARGYDVLRIPAIEILRDLGAVIAAIKARVGNPLHHPSGGPPPRSGEEL